MRTGGGETGPAKKGCTLVGCKRKTLMQKAPLLRFGHCCCSMCQLYRRAAYRSASLPTRCTVSHQPGPQVTNQPAHPTTKQQKPPGNHNHKKGRAPAANPQRQRGTGSARAEPQGTISKNGTPVQRRRDQRTMPVRHVSIREPQRTTAKGLQTCPHFARKPLLTAALPRYITGPGAHQEPAPFQTTQLRQGAVNRGGTQT